MPLELGISFLVAIGYTGPVAENARPPVRGMTAPVLHAWPPRGITASTPRRHVLRHILQTAQGLDDAVVEGLGKSINALAKRPDDSTFESQFIGQTDEQLVAGGICLAPAVVAGDPIVELLGERIRIGDFASVVLRGSLVPLTKVFAGLIDREGFPAALFYLRTPEQLIEVPLADVLYAARVKPPREFDGHDLLAGANPFVGQWHKRFHLADSMEPIGAGRTAAWVESMVSVLTVLRGQPE